MHEEELIDHTDLDSADVDWKATAQELQRTAKQRDYEMHGLKKQIAERDREDEDRLEDIRRHLLVPRLPLMHPKMDPSDGKFLLRMVDKARAEQRTEPLSPLRLLLSGDDTFDALKYWVTAWDPAEPCKGRVMGGAGADPTSARPSMSDAVHRFIEENFTIEGDGPFQIRARALFDLWQDWHRQIGGVNSGLPIQSFTHHVLNFHSVIESPRDAQGRYWIGLTPKSDVAKKLFPEEPELPRPFPLGKFLEEHFDVTVETPNLPADAVYRFYTLQGLNHDWHIPTKEAFKEAMSIRDVYLMFLDESEGIPDWYFLNLAPKSEHAIAFFDSPLHNPNAQRPTPSAAEEPKAPETIENARPTRLIDSFLSLRCNWSSGRAMLCEDLYREYASHNIALRISPVVNGDSFRGHLRTLPGLKVYEINGDWWVFGLELNPTPEFTTATNGTPYPAPSTPKPEAP
jgi:hypothetical protein